MFDKALVVIGEDARPILFIPENLPAGKTFLHIVDGGIDIGVGKKVYGQIRDIEDVALTMLGMQNEIGMATYQGKDPDEDLPEKIEYVAEVTDTRFKNAK